MEQKDKAMWVQTLWEPLEEMNQSPLHSKREGIRVAAYCRVSKTENNTKSLENQVSYYSKHIYNQPNWKFVGVYMDDQKSGATIKHRPGFKRMMRHAKEGKIDLILTKNISRFSRNTKELLEAVEGLKESGTTVYFEREQIETSKGMNTLLLKTHAAMAQDYIENISNQVKIGYQKRLNEAKPYYQSMYGYDNVSNSNRSKVIINQKEAEVVGWMFNQFIQGDTYAEISRQLVQKGIKTKKGNDYWGIQMIRKIINEVAYTGNKQVMKTRKDLLTGKFSTAQWSEGQQVITNNHPAIIPVEIFYQAQERVKEIEVNRYGKNISKENPLRKRLICGRCGRLIWKEGDYRYQCANAKVNVKLCDLEKLPRTYPLELGVKALFRRMMSIEIELSICKKKSGFKMQQNNIEQDAFGKMRIDLERILRKVNQNDHFEFGRLKILSALEVARIQNDDQKIKALEREYKEFEEKVSCIEDDRAYRDKALAWIQTVRNINEFIEGLTIEKLRAWMISMTIYSKGVYTIKWIDGQSTTIGEEWIPSIIKEAEDKRKIRENSIQEEGGIRLTEVTRALEISAPYQSLENKGETTVETAVRKEVVRLEHGLGIPELNHLKRTIIKNKMLHLEHEQTRKLKVAAYCRVSTHLDEQKVSLQTQLAFYSYKILSNPEWELVDIYVDEGVSGTNLAKRDNFNRMIEDAKQGKIDMIITKSISRFSRNVVNTLETIKMLHELKPPCLVYFQSEGLKSNDPNASILLSIMASTAQEEIVSLSSSITWGLQSLAQRGIITRTTDLYGYKIDKKGVWYVVEEEAEIVEQMYTMCANGKTVFDIIQWLKDDQIKSPTGREKWSESTVRGILRNEKYIGDYEYQKTYTPDVIGSKNRDNKGQVPKYYIEQHHPHIVTQQLYDKVQQVFKERRTAPVQDKRKDGTAGREAYYKKFICAECGRLVSRYRSDSRDTREGSSWRCRDSNEVVNSICEIKHGTLERYMDYHFIETLKHLSQNKDFSKNVKSYLQTIELTPAEWRHKKQLEEQMKELNQQLYEAVDTQVQKNGKDANLINQITDAIIQLREEHGIYLERIERRASEQVRLEKLIKYCEKMEDISVRALHNMHLRIKPGDSIYDTTNNAKYSTYMDMEGKDNFPEEVFSEQVVSGKLDKEGRITYKFAEGIEYGVPIIYKDYKKVFEAEITKIQFEELLNSKEVLIIRECCRTGKQFKEIKDCVGISSNTSFRKKIFEPLCKNRKLLLVEGTSKKRQKYYWNE